jgi:hypothetical protein
VPACNHGWVSQNGSIHCSETRPRRGARRRGRDGASAQDDFLTTGADVRAGGGRRGGCVRRCVRSSHTGPRPMRATSCWVQGSVPGWRPMQHGLRARAARPARPSGASVSRAWSCAQCRHDARLAHRPMGQARLGPSTGSRDPGARGTGGGSEGQPDDCRGDRRKPAQDHAPDQQIGKAHAPQLLSARETRAADGRRTLAPRNAVVKTGVPACVCQCPCCLRDDRARVRMRAWRRRAGCRSGTSSSAGRR